MCSSDLLVSGGTSHIMSSTQTTTNIDEAIKHQADTGDSLAIDYFDTGYDRQMSDLNVYYRATIEDLTNRYDGLM